jgi:hypothetical protein
MTDTPGDAVADVGFAPSEIIVTLTRNGQFSVDYDPKGDVLYLRAETLNALVAGYEARIRELGEALNTPEVDDFAKGAVLEAQHQRARWGSEHDQGKAPLDWFWLIGYLAQKAATAAIAGDIEKAKHHTISTAAVLANWHAALSGASTSMRPGISP